MMHSVRSQTRRSSCGSRGERRGSDPAAESWSKGRGEGNASQHSTDEHRNGQPVTGAGAHTASSRQRTEENSTLLPTSAPTPRTAFLELKEDAHGSDA